MRILIAEDEAATAKALKILLEKKMRRRMILAAMLAFFAVIMMIAVLVNVVNYFVVIDRADETINAILKFEEKRPEPREPEGPPRKLFMGLPDVESNYMTRFFTVHFDKKGNVIFASTDYIGNMQPPSFDGMPGQTSGQGTVKGLIVYAICFASILSLLLIFRRVRRR